MDFMSLRGFQPFLTTNRVSCLAIGLGCDIKVFGREKVVVFISELMVFNLQKDEFNATAYAPLCVTQRIHCLHYFI